MKEVFSYWGHLAIIAIVWCAIGFAIGWVQRGSYNEEQIKLAAKEEFSKATSWAISKGYLTVDTNKITRINSTSTN